MIDAALSSPRLPTGTPKAWLRISWIVLPLLATSYQILAARLAVALPPASAHGAWLAALMGQPSFWLLVATELGCFLCWMRILAVTTLAAAFPLTAISYVMVIASGSLLFGEPIGLLRLVGSAAILLGAALIAMSPGGRAA